MFISLSPYPNDHILGVLFTFKDHSRWVVNTQNFSLFPKIREASLKFSEAIS